MMYVKSIPVDEIKSNVNLVDYLDKFYNLEFKKCGSVHKCCCPFHEEDTGSFAVWGNGTYKCFGCGEHGDVIKFVESYEKIDFKEACQIVANNIGMSYTLEPPNPYHEQYKEQMTEHNRRYWYALKANQEALNYLMVKRQLTEETIDTFRLGYVPEDEYKFRNDIGGISNRIAFPILEHKKDKPRCVGMGYRAMGDELPKYKNDNNIDNKEDPRYGVFIKGDFLYGYSQAYPYIKEKDEIIITEGYMDVISMYQAGIRNIVSTMGVSLTESHIATISKITRNVKLLYDADKAGVDNMIRIIKPLLEANLNIKVVTLDAGHDPDSICLKYKFNTKKILSYIEYREFDAVKFALDIVLNRYEEVIIRERVKALTSVEVLFESIANEKQKMVYDSIIKNRLGL